MSETPPTGPTSPEEPAPRHRSRRSRRHRRRRRERRHERRRRRSADLAGLTGLGLGVVIGMPLGLLTYLVMRETLLPGALWSDETTMWAIIFGVTVPAALLGLVQGATPSRMGHALVVGLAAFLLGVLVFAILVTWGVAYLAEPMAVPEDEDAELVTSLAAGLAPLVAGLCAAVVAIWFGYGAWRRGGAWSTDRAR